MMGVAAAERGLAELTKRFSAQVLRRLPGRALTKTAYYRIAKQVGKWIGICVTKYVDLLAGVGQGRVPS